MTDPLASTDRLFYLADVVCDGRASEGDLAELDAILSSGEASRCRYLDFCRMHVTLALDLQAQRAVRKAWQQIDLGRATPFDVDPNLAPVPSPAAGAAPSPVLGFLGNAIDGAVGYLSSDWPVAYLVATVIFGVGLLIGSLVPVSRPQQIAEQSLPLRRAVVEPKMECVGRITGMVGCQWMENPKSEIRNPKQIENHQSEIINQNALVALGDKYALTSGSIEITYHTGAKVILQGPATYTVESATSGYLSVGKLTARVAKGLEIRDKSSDIPRPSSLIPHPLFAVRTPTAVVTDLGTEFGVVVSAAGFTQVHVLQGVIETRAVGAEGAAGGSKRVTEGFAVEMGPKGEPSKTVAFLPQSFVRTLSAPAETAVADAAYLKAVLADKPLGYWPLNEPAGTRKFLDRSGNGFHGYAINRVMAGEPGPLPGESRAVALDGDGFVNVGNRDAFALKNAFTVEAWVWIGNIRRQLWARVISVEPGTHPGIPRGVGWSLEIARPDPQDRKAPPASITLCTYAVQNYRFAISNELLAENRWLHVAVVIGGDNSARLYLNGEPQGMIAGTRCANVGPVWVEIGDGLGSLTEYVEAWHGRLAHVAVYPYTLSQRQIQNHYKLKSGKGTNTGAGVALPREITTK